MSIVVMLIGLAFVPAFFPVGWIILGSAAAVSGFYHLPRTEGLVGVYIALGGLIRLLAVYLSPNASSVWMVWMVLVSLAIITVATENKNSILRFTGISCILATVVTFTFCVELMFSSVIVVYAAGITANLVYLYRLLGRTPKIGEIFSFAPRTLSLYGLKKPIDQYSVLVVLIRGSMGAQNIIHELMARLESRCAPILLLGPTAPTQLVFSEKTKLAWVTTVSGVSKLEYVVLSPEDPSMVNVFLTKTLETMPEDKRPVILGDFLDNMIPELDERLFYKYYSDLASAARIKNYTIVFVVNADIHSKTEINVLKRFADVVIESREREDKGRLVKEARESNRVDSIHTDWEKY